MSDELCEEVMDAFDIAVTYYKDNPEMAKDITDIFDIFYAFYNGNRADKTMLATCQIQLKNLSVFAEEDEIHYFDDIIEKLKSI